MASHEPISTPGKHFVYQLFFSIPWVIKLLCKGAFIQSVSVNAGSTLPWCLRCSSHWNSRATLVSIDFNKSYVASVFAALTLHWADASCKRALVANAGVSAKGHLVGWISVLGQILLGLFASLLLDIPRKSTLFFIFVGTIPDVSEVSWNDTWRQWSFFDNFNPIIIHSEVPIR